MFGLNRSLRFAGLIVLGSTLLVAPDSSANTSHVQTRTVTETIVSPESQGWTLRGAGWCSAMDSSPWATAISGDHATVLRWAGRPRATMLHARGAHWTIGDMTLVGWTTLGDKRAADSQPVGDTGVWVRHRGAFNGSKGVIERVGIAGFRTAIRIGQRDDPGNDNLTLRNVQVAHCETAIRIDASQAMSTRAVGMHVRSTPVIVLAAEGGDVSIRDMDVHDHTTFLVVPEDGDNLGVNNSAFRFETIKVDNFGRDRVLTLVDQQRRTPLSVTFEDLRMPADLNRGLRATLRGRDSHLSIVDAKTLPKGTRFELHRGAKVTLRDCVLWRSARELIDPRSTDGTVVLRDCWRNGVVTDDIARVGD